MVKICHRSFLPTARFYGIALFAAGGIAASACGGNETRAVAKPGDGFVTVTSLDELRDYATRDDVKVRLNPGVYTLDRATSHRFIQFTGHDSHYDLHGVTLRVDTRLFRQFGDPGGVDGFYRAIDLAGERIVFEGAKIETFGDLPGIQSRNKIVNVTGSGAVLQDVDITTSGSNPWGYGSLYGIASGDVRKMNGIRIGWPAKGAKVIHCSVHMRAMGHGIFVQGAVDTSIEDCQVDGLLRPTNEILAEKSGYAFDRGFKAAGSGYVEGVHVGAEGAILPDEMVSLSEDGIRLYDQGGGNHPTGPTTIRGCTVRQMRRGICTGLGPAPDRVIDCEVRDCVATGFNIGSGDLLDHCRADAKYSEALSCPFRSSRGVRVDLTLLDSRGGLANDVLATINGGKHSVRLHADRDEFVPSGMVIALATRRGYASYQKEVGPVRDLDLINETPARIVRDAKE